MTWPAVHHLLKQLFQFLLVSGLLIEHPRGIPPLFAVPSPHYLPMTAKTVMIRGDPLVATAARAVICLIVIEIEIEGGIGTGIETMEGIEMEIEIEIEIGTDIETGGMSMIEDPGKQTVGITTENQVLEEAEAGAGVGAEAEAEVCVWSIDRVRTERNLKTEHPHPAT